MAQAPFLILERQFALDFLHSARTKKINGSGPYILFWACSRGVRVEGLSLCISYCYHPSNSKVPRIATCLSQTMHPLFFFLLAYLCKSLHNKLGDSKLYGKFRGQVFRAFWPFYLQCRPHTVPGRCCATCTSTPTPLFGTTWSLPMCFSR